MAADAVAGFAGLMAAAAPPMAAAWPPAAYPAAGMSRSSRSDLETMRRHAPGWRAAHSVPDGARRPGVAYHLPAEWFGPREELSRAAPDLPAARPGPCAVLGRAAPEVVEPVVAADPRGCWARRVAGAVGPYGSVQAAAGRAGPDGPASDRADAAVRWD